MGVFLRLAMNDHCWSTYLTILWILTHHTNMRLPISRHCNCYITVSDLCLLISFVSATVVSLFQTCNCCITVSDLCLLISFVTATVVSLFQTCVFWYLLLLQQLYYCFRPVSSGIFCCCNSCITVSDLCLLISFVTATVVSLFQTCVFWYLLLLQQLYYCFRPVSSGIFCCCNSCITVSDLCLLISFVAATVVSLFQTCVFWYMYLLLLQLLHHCFRPLSSDISCYCNSCITCFRPLSSDISCYCNCCIAVSDLNLWTKVYQRRFWSLELAMYLPLWWIILHLMETTRYRNMFIG